MQTFYKVLQCYAIQPRHTRWIQNALGRNLICTYSCCIQIISVRACLYNVTQGSLNILLKVPGNLWHILSNVALPQIRWKQSRSNQLRQTLPDNTQNVPHGYTRWVLATWKTYWDGEAEQFTSNFEAESTVSRLSANSNDGNLQSWETWWSSNIRQRATSEAATVTDQMSHHIEKEEIYLMLCDVGGTNECHSLKWSHVFICLNNSE